MRWRRTISRGVATAASVVAATAVTVIGPTAAFAQDGAGAAAVRAAGQASQGPQRPQGPMTVERVENGFVIAPDFRISTFDDRTARFAGLYGGWMIDNALLIGGAGYWLTNGSSGEDMAYGGVVVQWADHANRTAGFGARSLLGVGRATLADDVTIMTLVPVPGGRAPSFAPLPYPSRYRFRSRVDFVVFEPQVNGFVNVSKHLRLTAGVGYRMVGDARRFDDRLRGAVGSVGLEIGSFGRGRRQGP